MNRYNTTRGYLNRAELALEAYKDCAYWLGIQYAKSGFSSLYREAMEDLRPTCESCIACYCRLCKNDDARGNWKRLYRGARSAHLHTVRLSLFEGMALALVTFED